MARDQVGISQEAADEFLGMWARPTCGLKDERNEDDVWIPVEFVLFKSLGYKSEFVMAAETKGRTAREKKTMDSSKHVTEP